MSKIKFIYHLRQCYNKYKELEVDLGKMNEKNEKILHIFRDSIEKLKTVELHPKMQGAKEKFLIDIYFDESKMNVWKEKCAKSSDFITKKIKMKGDLILTEKAKIRTEKNTNILQLKNEWNSIVAEYESFINEKEIMSSSILSSISEDIKAYNKNLNSLNESDDAIECIKTVRTKVNTYKDLLSTLTSNSVSIEEFSKKMKNLLIKSSVQINVIFTNYHNVKKSLLEIMEKVEKYSQGLINLEKDFSYLGNPTYFPQAYQASIIEIKRRIIFNKKITKDFERLKQLIVKENLNRKQFIQDYGKYLTHDYVPQLKFSDLKLSIDFNNNEEMLNLPNLLDEDEELTVNNNNLYLEYDEISLAQSQSTGNCNNEGLLINKLPNLRKNSEDKKVNDFEEQICNLNAKISELQIVINVKESEIKKIFNKLEQKERKLSYMQSETEKLSTTVESIGDNFLKQITYKEQKLKERNIEIENLSKIISGKSNNLNLENCPMCKDIISNSIDYQSWGGLVKDYQEKITEKNKILTKLDARYQDLVSQTLFVKKTFFKHLNSSLEQKNLEILAIKSSYENKLMFLEDGLSQEHARNDKNEKNMNSILSNNSKAIEEKNLIINSLENKLKDFSKLFANYENENKLLKKEKEHFKKMHDESKNKENNLLIDIKMRDTKIENFIEDLKNFEKQIDVQKKNINHLSEEIINKVKENSHLKYNLENKTKLIDELEKALENSKINHIETLNEVHKANQITIEKLNQKIDEMADKINEKNKITENIKFNNQQLLEFIHLKDDDISNLNSEIELLKTKNEELIKNCEINENEWKKKFEEIQINLSEKDKKLNEFHELTKFFCTNENFSGNKTNANTESNNLLTHNSLTMGITNLNINNITKLLEVEDFINVKRLEKGLRSIFVPHSPGVYVSINLNSCANDATSNLECNYDENKYFKCNSILNINSLNSDLKELLIENSLIIIGKVSKLTEFCPSIENNPFQLPEDNTYILIDLDKIDYVIGFQGEEMIFRNYLF